MASPSLENWALKPSWAILRHQTTLFRENNFLYLYWTPTCYYTHWYISNASNITLIGVRMWMSCLPQVDLPYWTPWYELMPCQPILLTQMGLSTYLLSIIWYNFQNLIIVEGWASQNPTPIWLLSNVKYWATRRRRSSIFYHCICSIVEKKT
jgi:hypothetical protein